MIFGKRFISGGFPKNPAFISELPKSLFACLNSETFF